MELDVNTNEREMLQTRPDESGGMSLQEDVNMNNMSDVTEALPAKDAPNEPNDKSHSGSEKDLRLDLLIHSFEGQVVQLKDIKTPPQCLEHPDIAEDALFAYLDKTIFTVKVWTNFDTFEEVFFEGARAAACGKLRLPKRKHDWLFTHNPDLLNFQRVRFEICTPFRALAEIDLEVRQQSEGSSLRVELRPKDELCTQTSTSTLIRFLDGCIKAIRRDGRSVPRLNMQDLWYIARLFRRVRRGNDREEVWEGPAYGGGEWAGVEEPRRFGRGLTRFQFQS